MWTNLFGILATIASLSITFIGFPQQIYKNYKCKNVEGIAPFLIYSAVLTYFLWTVYAWIKPDLFLGITQTSGLVFSSILLAQLFIYQKQSRS